MINKEKLKNIVLNNFEFERVRRFMEADGWQYEHGKGAPSIEILKDTASKLLDDAFNYKTISTGGFTARWRKKKKYLELTWGLDSCAFITEDGSYETN